MGTPVGVRAVRVSALTADGTPDFDNPVGGFLFCAGLSKFDHKFDKQTGKEIYDEDAGGNGCVNIKRPDRIKRVTGTLTLCKRFFDLDALMVDEMSALVDGDDITGVGVIAASGCGTSPNPNGVALELWSENINCDQLDADNPYVVTVVTRAFVSPPEFVLENGNSLPQYTFYGVPNSNFGDGPFGEWDNAVGTDDMPIFWDYASELPTCATPPTLIPIPAGAS